MNILFATMPFDGHFNPLTSIAMHLRAAGHDVRWYAGPSYGSRLAQLGIPHLPFTRAREINGDTIAEHFPERARLRGVALIRFDGRHIFVGNTTHFFEDLCELDAAFTFDALVCDTGFFAMRLVKAKLGKLVYAVDVAPSGQSDPLVPPNFVGMQPARTAIGRLAHQALGALMERMAMGDASADLNAMLVAGRNTFDRAELRARVGETIALRLENTDTMVHSFDIDAFDVHVAMPTGTAALALFTATTPGSYSFYCRIPGHTEAGMAGILIVEP